MTVYTREGITQHFGEPVKLFDFKNFLNGELGTKIQMSCYFKPDKIFVVSHFMLWKHTAHKDPMHIKLVVGWWMDSAAGVLSCETRSLTVFANYSEYRKFVNSSKSHKPEIEDLPDEQRRPFEDSQESIT